MTDAERSSLRGGSVALLVVQGFVALVGGSILHTQGNQMGDCGAGCNPSLYSAVGAAFIWSAVLLLAASTTLVVAFWRRGEPRLWPPAVGAAATFACAIIAGLVASVALPAAG